MTTNRIYRAVIVEDEPMIMDNLIQKIEKAGYGFTVVGRAQDGSEALAVIDSLKPDILFTDIRMPKLNGIELIRNVKSKYPEMQIVIISGYGKFEYAQQAIKLGVKDYLLKPISSDSIAGTLAEMKTRLDQTVSEQERDILLSSAAGLPPEASLPNELANRVFGIFIICIGHLLNQIPVKQLNDSFARVWGGIDWGGMLPPNARWWVLDEKNPNLKCLIVAVDDLQMDAAPVAAHLLNTLTSRTDPLPVNISACSYFVEYKDIWPLSQSLRVLLDQRLIIGHSAVFTLSAPMKGSIPPAILDAAFQNKAIALISQGGAALLRTELQLQLDKWQVAQQTQRWMENVLRQLFKLFQHQIPSVSEEDVMQAEYELNEKLSMSPSLTSIYEDVWCIIQRMLVSSDRNRDSSEKFITIVEQYIQNNFCGNINVEDIARKFNFNSTYLTKVFKKAKGITPVKYITMLRIKEAERLMQEKLDMDIKQIGEIVGYDDPQYFSRIFKIVTGQSPSEYRDRFSKVK